jgi:5-methylcytosine-specific restriction protein A
MTRKAWDKGGKTVTEQGYGWQWQKLRKLILIRDSYLCQVCLELGRPTPATQVDHIIPKASGGSDDPGNLRALCRPCHDLKTIADKGHRIRKPFGADGWPIDD